MMAQQYTVPFEVGLLLLQLLFEAIDSDVIDHSSRIPVFSTTIALSTTSGFPRRKVADLRLLVSLWLRVLPLT